MLLRILRDLVARLNRQRTYSLDSGCVPVHCIENERELKFVISDGFGKDKRKGKGHWGVDFAERCAKRAKPNWPTRAPWYYCPSDIASARACAAGEVVRVIVDLVRQGTAVYIKHGGHMSVYRHLKEVRLVTGQFVEQGEHIGIVSHAPKNKTNPFNHLHFEIWKLKRWGTKLQWHRKSQAVDPAPYLQRWARAK